MAVSIDPAAAARRAAGRTSGRQSPPGLQGCEAFRRVGGVEQSQHRTTGAERGGGGHRIIGILATLGSRVCNMLMPAPSRPAGARAKEV